MHPCIRKNYPQSCKAAAEHLQQASRIDIHTQPLIHIDNHRQPSTNTEKDPQPLTHTNLTDHPQPPSSPKRHPRPHTHRRRLAPTKKEKLVQRRQEMDRQMREYPLSVNLSDVVDRILNGESPQVKPVHNTTKYSYVINPIHTCRYSTVTDGQGSSIFLLLLVKSKFNHFKNRDAIRSTWGNESLVMGLASTRVKTVFLLGNVAATLPGRLDIRDQLKAESLQHGDLV